MWGKSVTVTSRGVSGSPKQNEWDDRDVQTLAHQSVPVGQLGAIS